MVLAGLFSCFSAAVSAALRCLALYSTKTYLSYSSIRSRVIGCLSYTVGTVKGLTTAAEYFSAWPFVAVCVGMFLNFNFKINK